MLVPIVHRGPDGMGIWQEGRVAFGHRRLSILDLTDAADQPMLTADGDGVLTYNGEVYNYRELRQVLERERVKFRSSGDTEVVLQALHHWGVERALTEFDGMFALAYYDRREGMLWLARDRVGIKPLLAADTGSELIFGSEAKALLAHPRMQRRLNHYALAKWVLSRGLWSNQTLFANIESLRTRLLLEDHRTRHRKASIFSRLDGGRCRPAGRCLRREPDQYCRQFSRPSETQRQASSCERRSACHDVQRRHRFELGGRLRQGGQARY